jgi:hypothetical protein
MTFMRRGPCRLATATAFALMVCAVPHAAQAGPKSPLRFINGHIYTPQGWRSAMEIKGDRIVRIGTKAQAKRWPRGTAKVVDLGGRTVFPGLYDMHVHPVLQAKGDEGRCRIPQDAAVISRGDDLFLETAVPSIARYHLDGRLLGRTASRLMLQLLRQPHQAPSRFMCQILATSKTWPLLKCL